MITKILLTAAVILGLLIYLRRSGGGTPSRRGGKAPHRAVEPVIPRAILYIFIVMMLLSSAVIFYYNWQKSYRIITVRVINTQSGHEDSYQVRRGEVDGRRFETLDGKVVILADVERMEIDIAAE